MNLNRNYDGTLYETRELYTHIPNGTTHLVYNFHCEDCHHEFATEPCWHFNHLEHPWKPDYCFSWTTVEDLPELIET